MGDRRLLGQNAEALAQPLPRLDDCFMYFFLVYTVNPVDPGSKSAGPLSSVSYMLVGINTDMHVIPENTTSDTSIMVTDPRIHLFPRDYPRNICPVGTHCQRFPIHKRQGDSRGILDLENADTRIMPVRRWLGRPSRRSFSPFRNAKFRTLQ